jgi:hypothetical protein
MAGQGGPDPGGQREPGVPRWVKVIGIVVAVLVVLIVIAQLTGIADEHGPGRHLPGGHAPPVPAGGHVRDGR